MQYLRVQYFETPVLNKSWTKSLSWLPVVAFKFLPKCHNTCTNWPLSYNGLARHSVWAMALKYLRHSSFLPSKCDTPDQFGIAEISRINEVIKISSRQKHNMITNCPMWQAWQIWYRLLLTSNIRILRHPIVKCDCSNQFGIAGISGNREKVVKHACVTL